MQTGPALKVSIYVQEGSTHHGFQTASSILDFLFYRGVSGATMLRGIAGFGADRHLHTASSVELSDQMPVKIEFIETPEKVDELMDKLQELAGTGMIEVQPTTILKAANSQPEPARPASRKITGKAKMLRIYVDESDRWNDKPLHEAIVEAMRTNEMAGVTVYKSILAYGSGGEVLKPKTFTNSTSLMLSTIDSEERIATFLAVLDKMIESGLVVISDVDVIRYNPPIQP